jgi:hypothetical protein
VKAQIIEGFIRDYFEHYFEHPQDDSAVMAFDIASEALQLFGGNGLTREYPIEKLMRDARASLIEDGENNVLGLKAASILSNVYKNENNL